MLRESSKASGSQKVSLATGITASLDEEESIRTNQAVSPIESLLKSSYSTACELFPMQKTLLWMLTKTPFGRTLVARSAAAGLPCLITRSTVDTFCVTRHRI